MKFREIAIGDTFDWIDERARMRSNWQHRFVKVSAIHYRGLYDTMTAESCYLLGDPTMVKNVDASVFSVMRAAD